MQHDLNVRDQDLESLRASSMSESSSFDSSLVSSALSKRQGSVNSSSSFKPQTSSFLKTKKEKVVVSKFKMRALDEQLKDEKAYRAQFMDDNASSLESFRAERSTSPKTPQNKTTSHFAPLVD